MKITHTVIAFFLLSVINVCTAKPKSLALPFKGVAISKTAAPQKQVGKATYNRLHLKPLKASDFKIYKI